MIDDDEGVRGALDSLFRSAGYAVKTFGTPDDFLSCAEADYAACLVLDIRLGEADGLEFQQELLDSEVLVPVILITGHGDIPMAVRAMKAGAVDFLPKPFEEGKMLAAVHEAKERSVRGLLVPADGSSPSQLLLGATMEPGEGVVCIRVYRAGARFSYDCSPGITRPSQPVWGRAVFSPACGE